MIFVPLYHSLHSVEVYSSPFLLVSQSDILLVSNTMRFNISFIHKKKSIFITHIIPELLLGIMRSPDSIYIIALHNSDILENCGFINNMTCNIIMFMHI